MRPKRIVLSGAPSSGKSTALEAIRQSLGDKVILVPESAVVLLSGGFPSPSHDDLEQIHAFQKAILSVQENLESICDRKNVQRLPMIFDRAKLDGAGFWPPGPEHYLATFSVDLKAELARYDHVVFLELPEEEFFGGLLKTRFHDYKQSKESETQLASVWSQHLSFQRIPAQKDFSKKIENVLSVINSLISRT
ncbi:AAA family ATPase [Bdellovibrio bacteriovorus]|uniref:AAA family ATPase n=1 Tax=Bdellovibrio TaxID=958 RepID=UPI0035A9950A